MPQAPVKQLDERSIVLVDDDFVIREVIKTFVNATKVGSSVHYSFYSSEDGLEGLGYIMIARPDIVIIDTTLPKYSGRELIDYLVTNQYLFKEIEKIIILVENEIEIDLPGSNFILLDKNDRNFLSNLIDILSPDFHRHNSTITRLCSRITYWANKKDLLLHKLSLTNNRFKKIPIYPAWIFTEIITSFYLSILRLFTSRINDANLKQSKKDLRRYRVKHYPTFVGIFVSILLILIQLCLFVTGGFVIFGTRIQSVFAMGSGEKGYVFNSEENSKYEFDAGKIEFTNEGVKLKTQDAPDSPTEVIPTPEVPTTTPSPETEVTPVPETPTDIPDEPTTPIEETPAIEEPVTPTPETPTNNEENTTTEPEVTTPQGKFEGVVGKVFGESTENIIEDNPETTATVSGYPTDGPSIETKESTKYSNLEKIIERSNINTDESSVQSSEEYNETHKETITNIKYQLSPDKENWYYYIKDERRWGRTTQESVSSNTIQEINENIEDYETNFSSGELYLRIYLITNNSNNTPVLKEVVVEREQAIATQEDTVVIAEPKIPEETVSSMDFSKLEVKIFNASYYDGKKVVRGKVLLKDHKVKGKYEIEDTELAKYDVNIYYSKAATATQGDLIGTTSLYKNAQGEIEFTLIKASTSGGYITAEVMFKEDTDVKSGLAKPMENSTFTVDSTGDEADAALDGLCATSGGKCTLRAAITEANNVGGSDNIYFNIPTSDTGYRDYDLPDTTSSGDSSGGDDYWTIRPASAFPLVTGETLFDGTTQSTNQGNMNTSGPEIEIDGVSAGNVDGIYFTATADNSTVSSIVINRYSGSSTKSGIVILSDNTVIQNSYIGISVKGTTSKANNIGISVTSAASNTQIIDNVISGNFATTRNSSGILLTDVSNIEIKRNIIGLTATQTAPQANKYGIYYNNATNNTKSNITIGGTSASDANIFASNYQAGFYYYYPNTISYGSITNFTIQNNIFGTNTSKTFIDSVISNQIYIYANSDNSAGLLISDNTIWYGELGNITVRYTKDVVIKNNDIRYCSTVGINIYVTDHDSIYGDVPIDIPGDGPAGSRNEAIIENNTISNNHIGITINSSSPIIKGNVITNNATVAIYNATTVQQTSINRISALTSSNGYSNFLYFYSKPIIGGQNTLSGSLCGGLEKNCINSNTYGGIQSVGTVPWNEATLYADNNFSGGNNGRNSIEQLWPGLYEVFSNNTRRTDITDLSLSFTPSAGTVSKATISTPVDTSSPITTVTNKLIACLDSSNCADQGISNSTGNSEFLGPTTYTMTTNTWFNVLEYGVNGSGTKTTYKDQKYDKAHLASTNFSFDGDSTTDATSTSTSRTITVDGVSQTYYDRGEPWTDSVTANRDIKLISPAGVNPSGLSNHQFVFGSFQIMEVELVDANPVLQEDGNFIITVDSSTNEDNVSTAGYNDGAGAYSGGGSQGIDGLANGKTSLKEAIFVANQFNAGGKNIKISFNIPTTDSGWNTSSFPNAFVIKPVTDGFSLLRDNITIDGSTQTAFTGDTSIAVTEPESLPLVGNATTGPEIIIDASLVSNPTQRLFQITGRDKITIKSLGLYNKSNSRAVIYSNGSGTKNITITNCTFVNNGSRAIEFRTNYVASVLISENVFRGNNLTDPTSYSYGIVPVLLKDGIIRDNTFAGNGINAINLQVDPTSTSIYITNNLIKSNLNPNTTDVGSSINVSSNTGGKPVLIEDNTIIGNRGDGIIVSSTSVGATTIKNNIINSNTALSINLSGGIEDSYTVTANDTGDEDSGANGLQNFPVFTTATYMGAGGYHVVGTLDGKSSEGPWNIEICESDTSNSGHGDCLQTLATLTTDSAGNWETDITISGDTGSPNRKFSALATNNTGSTSEFSLYTQTTTTIYPITAVYPINSQQTTERQPFLDWAANGDPDIDHYEVWFGDDEDDLTKVAETTSDTTNFTFTNLKSYDTYYWKIVDVRKNGTVNGDSGIQSFEIIEKLTPLSLIYPTGGIQIDELKPTFRWEKSSSADTTYYQLYLKKLSGNEQPNETVLVNDRYKIAQVDGVETTTYQPKEALEYGKYEWIVFSNNAEGKSEGKSEVGQFQIIEAIVKPITPELPVTQAKGTSDLKTKIANASKTTALVISILAALFTLVVSTAMVLTSVPVSASGRILVGLFVGFIFPKKRKTSIGLILDSSNNNHPIPFALIKLYKNGRVYSKTYSDSDGKFEFSGKINSEIAETSLPNKGNNVKYSVEVSAHGYQNKEQILSSQKDNNNVVLKIILNRSQKEFGIIKHTLFYEKQALIKITRIALAVLFIFGFVYTFFATIVSPSFLNITILSLYLIVALSVLIINKLRK